MNRAERREQRREGRRNTPSDLRDVPVLDITSSDLAQHFPGLEDGDIVTLKGFGRGQSGGYVKVERGQESPVRIKVRGYGLVKG